MKITNFTPVSGGATVDVETGVLWWKKKETKHVALSAGGDWFWVDTGDFVSGYIISRLERSRKAKETMGLK